MGSVEFVEKHAEILNAQAVAYINVDFGVKGTTELQALGTRTSVKLNAVLKSCRHPAAVMLQARQACRTYSPL